MSKFIIIDSNKNYAERLASTLNSSNHAYSDGSLLLPANNKNLRDWVSGIASTINPDACILINAEAKFGTNSLHQNQDGTTVAFWLRCGAVKIKNPIVFYSTQSINALLRKKPGHYIMLAPGSYHYRLPVNIEKLKHSKFKSLDDFKDLKPYLKPKINLDQTRHRYANYVGMVLMRLLAQVVWKPENGAPNINLPTHKELSEFVTSLNYFLLKAYFNLSLESNLLNKIPELKINPFEKKILLVDDLAENGWEPILSQMIYGNFKDQRFKSLKIQYDKKQFNLEKTKEELKTIVTNYKPHLLLLDLRLNDEEGDREVTELGGYQLLKHIKSEVDLKGLPVIMFTGSSNAETTKTLISLGAEAVWTKPGLDEGLNFNSITNRYIGLLNIVDKTLNKFENLNYRGSSHQFSDLRIQLLEKIEWIKYRLTLYKNNEIELIHKTTKFFDYTDIYIDTNFLMVNSNADAVENLISLYIVSKITSNLKKTYKYSNRTFQYNEPKVVISNQIFDELIKKIKRLEEPMNTLIYSVIRELFGKDIRTEYKLFTDSKSNFQPQFELRNPKEDLYADPFIIDDISHLIVLEYKNLKYRDGSYEKKKHIQLPGRKVLLVSDDVDLKEKTERMFDLNKFASISGKEFNDEANKIEL